MLARTLRQSSFGNGLIRLALVFVLVFSAAHVALHDAASDGLTDYIACEACRFDQAPAGLFPPALFAPLLLPAVALTVLATQLAPSHFDLAYLARAPPLF